MAKRALSTFTDQVTQRLRKGMAEGRWKDTLPGRKRLAEELGCSPWTIEEAIQRLTKEGILVSPGPGHRRRIVLSKNLIKPRALRVIIIPYEPHDRNESYMIDLLHKLRETGHEASFADKTLMDLGMKVDRVARMATKAQPDAWVVCAGSRDVLDWFANQETPAFALFGRNTQIPLASIALHKAEAMIELADKLVDLGHRRITLLTREERRKPTPGHLEQAFLDRLEELGISTGSYNIPDWGVSPRDLRQAMDSLFKFTPPTALIVDQPSLCVAVIQHLSRLKLRAPDDVSLACTDLSDAFEWCDPSITHITWDSKPVINRVVKWADKISRGKDHRARHVSKVRLVTGGTIGVVSKKH